MVKFMDKVFKALSDKTRLELFLIVNELPNVCLCDLETCFSLSNSNLSRHLKELHQANLLEVEKKGKWKYYQISLFGSEFVKLISQQANKSYLQTVKNIINKIERSSIC